MYQGQTQIIARDTSVPIQSYDLSLIPFQADNYGESLNPYESITGDSLGAAREMPMQSRADGRIHGQYIVLLDETKISSSPNP
jgi:hypothetical protein